MDTWFRERVHLWGRCPGGFSSYSPSAKVSSGAGMDSDLSCGPGQVMDL